jgi:O-methyltransferase involved in polyketide biosynthesis
MVKKKALQLGKLQETLLLPLWGRAIETQKKDPLLCDTLAVEIITEIDYDFSIIAKNISYVTQFAWIARSIHIDDTIKQFLIKFPDAVVVNLACGLDTTFARIDNGSVTWYDLDLPDVIKLRKKFICDSDRRRTISSSFLDYSWLNKMNIRNNILFIAAGLFYYFEENQIKDFFIKIADTFPGCEIFFDSASPLGVKVANKKVIRDSGMDESAILKWGIKSAKEIEKWDQRIHLIKEYPIFKKMKKGFSLRKKYTLFLSDFLKIMSMVHLRIEKK